jgi:type IV secretory pathway VirB4 component
MRAKLNPDQRTITAFRTLTQHEWVRAATRAISREGTFGYLFDGVQSLEINPVWQYFELDVLAEHKEVAGPMMSCLTNEAKRLFLKGGQIELDFDELWMLDGVYLDEVEAFIRLLRTNGAHVALATQSAADLATHKGIITGNCPYTFYVPGRSAKEPTGIKHLRNMNLQMHHINWLASAREKAEYLLQGPDGVELVNFMAGDATRAICMALDQEEHFNMIERAMAHPHSFLAGWLLECKLPQQAEWVMRYDGDGSGNPAVEMMQPPLAAE